ncbi:MAG: phage tail protein, partial [Fusobacteriaceae bacterium]|nr:phage tail protein [Fusobacteriaceae bacterium]
NSNALRAILDTKASIINDKWGSMSIFDIPDDTAYGSAIEFKKTNNWIDADQIVNYGVTKFGGEYFHTSIFAAFLSASVDASNDGIPYESPSNKNIKAEGIAYKVGNVYKDLNLDEPEANLLNENGICTILSRANGIVYWGNRTSVFQPGGNMDPKDMWIPIKRMFKYIANTVMLNTEIDVDKPMTYSKAKNIKMNINIYLASLVSDEKLLGASVDFLEIDNPIGDLVQGKFKWHLFLGGVIPGETLEYILEYEGKYLTGFYAA